MNKILAIGAALLGCVSVSQTVQASAYAVSVNSITNFGITFSNPVSSFGSFTFSGDVAGINMASVGNGGVTDATGACVGCAYDNSFIAHGSGAASYAYGDSKVLNSNVLGSAGAASAIGEAYLTAPTAGFGYGQGLNTMTGTINISAGHTTSLTFDFMADPYLQAILSSGGSNATADMSMSITITQGTTVFSWTPDGNLGANITGGTEIYDPFSLNTSLPQLVNGGALYDMANGHFRATTGVLGAGSYNLNISMFNAATVETVPVPAAAWLLGSGLAGLLGISRRRQQVV